MNSRHETLTIIADAIAADQEIKFIPMQAYGASSETATEDQIKDLLFEVGRAGGFYAEGTGDGRYKVSACGGTFFITL